MSDNAKVVTIAYELDSMGEHLGALGKLIGNLRDIKSRLAFQLHGTHEEPLKDGKVIGQQISLTGANAVLHDHVETLQDLINELHGHVGSFDEAAPESHDVGSTGGGPVPVGSGVAVGPGSDPYNH